MDENKSSEYSFIKETIKEPPLNKRKILLKIIMVIICALIFGLVSATVFIYTVKQHTPPQEEDLATVNFPRDEETVELSENEPQDGEEYAVSPDEVSIASEEETPEEETENDGEEDKEEETEAESENIEETGEEQEEKTSVSVSYITERVSLTVDDYKQLYGKLKKVATEVSRSVVTVTGIVNDTDWLDNLYENTDLVSGLIVANNGKDLLILSELPSVEGEMELNVTFADETTLAGEVKSIDTNTGMVIISVPLESIPESTRNFIVEAVLGSSRGSGIVGMPVMALGSPLGIQGSQCFGRTTSNQRELHLPDRNIHVLSTDIYGSENATGVITNYDGQVIGIISQGTSMEDAPNLLSAYAISDIKDIIEKLSNGSAETYLGIYGTEVTRKLNEEEGIPMGYYVMQVALDSPAMQSGIQSGDIITRFGTVDFSESCTYTEEMMKYQPGDEAVITVQRYSKGEYQEMTFEVTFDDAADHSG